MTLNVSAWSIRSPMPAIVSFLMLVVLGIASFVSLPITRFPNIDFPNIQVTITQSGAAPGELETQVTRKVEDAVAGADAVWHILSEVSDGASITTIQFYIGTDVDRALNDVKDHIAKIRADLPRTIDEPIVQRIDIEGLPIVTYSASAPSINVAALSWFVDDTVARDLQGIQGVASVTRSGGVDREIRISLDARKLLALGVTAADVNRQVRATNVDLAGGRGELADQEQAIRTLAGARSIDALRTLPIWLPGGRKVRLDELGSVTDGAAEARTFARLDGQPIVAFGVSRTKGASDATVSDLVEQHVAKIRQVHPEVRLVKVDTQVDNTIGNFRSAMETLIEGAILAVMVVFIFLRDIRATVVSAVALPLSVLPTFWAISALGFSLNLVTLLAITLVTGILVDDAIVEVENIVRHMQMGKSAWRASLDAADEIGLAVIAISMTIVAVFSPVSFMGGIAGQYFRQFGLTVAISVVFSLMVARLITPVAAAYVLRSRGEVVEGEGPLLRLYTHLMRWSLRHRWITLALGTVLFVGSITSTKLLPSGFLPAEDVARTLLAVELPPGSRLDDTDAITRTIADRLKPMPEIRSIMVYGGEILGGAAEVRKATLVINLVHRNQRSIAQKELEAEIAGRIGAVPDIRFWFLRDNGQRDLQLVIAGTELAAINDTANELASEMRQLPMINNPISTAELDQPELRIIPKAQLAADLGISTEALSETIRVATLGDIDANLAKFNAGDRLIPIRVELEEHARADIGLLKALRVGTSHGGSVPLAALARFEMSRGPTAINRYDRSRRVTIEADLAGQHGLGEAIDALHALPAVRHLPNGVELRPFGDAEVMGEVFSAFGTAMGAGLMMVYGVLILLFGSFGQPITILCSLPLSVGGAIMALLITNRPISMPVVIGVLMLMGVVTKNAIMLVDFAIEAMRRGQSRTDALLDAGRKRARPIIMTTLAMVAGMLPSALALGDGGAFRSPMAIAVIGGLVVSTALSLIFVPAVFTFLDDAGQLAWRLLGRVLNHGDDVDPHRTDALIKPFD
jgi:multidrug efflux pump subunit AcrB